MPHTFYQDAYPLPSIVQSFFTIIDSLFSIRNLARTLRPFLTLPEDSNQWVIRRAIKQWGVRVSNLLLHLLHRCRGWIFANKDFENYDYQFEDSSLIFSLRWPCCFASCSPMGSISIHRIETFIELLEDPSQKIWVNHPRKWIKNAILAQGTGQIATLQSMGKVSLTCRMWAPSNLRDWVKEREGKGM